MTNSDPASDYFCFKNKDLMAEQEGFEPSIRGCRIHTFQACAFDHSATAPRLPWGKARLLAMNRAVRKAL